MAVNEDTLRFTADDSGTSEDAEWIATGVHNSSSHRYLLFERVTPIGSDEDWGIYVEFDDQMNSGHDAVESCIVD